MSHLDEGQLAALFDNELEPEEQRAAEQHLASCTDCRALWEEIRALAAEADRLVGAVDLPPATRPKPAPASVATSDSAPQAARRPLPWRTLGWAASVVLAVGLGYQLRSAARETTDMRAALPASQPVLAERADKAATAAAPAAEPTVPSTVRRNEKAVAADRADAGMAPAPPTPSPTQPTTPAPAADAIAAPAVTGKVALSQSEAEPRAARNLAAPTRAGFRQVNMEEAVRTLAGSIRLVDGLQPVKVLAAPGGLVPSADPGQEFIRVVYQDPPGRELWLDQQRPAPASEFARSRSAESVLPGDTLPVPAEAGSRSVQWIDQHGFLLRLTGFLSGDSLRAMIPRVH